MGRLALMAVREEMAGEDAGVLMAVSRAEFVVLLGAITAGGQEMPVAAVGERVGVGEMLPTFSRAKLAAMGVMEGQEEWEEMEPTQTPVDGAEVVERGQLVQMERREVVELLVV